MLWAILRDVDQDRSKGDNACRDKQGFCRVQKRRLEGVWIEVKPSEEQTPYGKVQYNVEQKDDNSNRLKASKSIRN